MSMVDLSTLTPDHFTPLAGQKFLITPPGGEEVEMPLWKVSVPNHKAPRGFRQPFTLDFEPPPGLFPPQGLSLVKHETLGTMELFMTPVQARAGCYYEAVFG